MPKSTLKSHVFARLYVVKLIVVSLAIPLHSQEIKLPNDDSSEPAAAVFPNVKSLTFGGKQFWTDHQWRRGWKLQNNVLTGHWRLIDDEKIRHAWGSRAACEQVLKTEVPDNTLPCPRVALLIHGLMRSSDSMAGIGRALQKSSVCTVATFEYASTRASIADHAVALLEVVQGLPENVELDFVGHSLGNIVVRHMIGDLERNNDTETLARIKHVVMLGPPNQGASIARQLSKVGGLFKWVTGESGMALGPEWSAFEAKLATPHCPFGIVAGRLPDSNPQNPLLDGQGDFVVSVEETKLPGAKDFLEVPRLHSFLMDDPAVQQAVVHFLDHESFD